jgi:hypothetical protein
VLVRTNRVVYCIHDHIHYSHRPGFLFHLQESICGQQQ